MIIESKEDVVRLSGALRKNQWLTIRAAAGMLLQDYPEGIIVDCSNLQEVSEEGAKTFLEAMKDIDAAGTRIIVANLPKNVMEVIKTVPGVRSQLPVANSIDEARSSLRMLRKLIHSPSTGGTAGLTSVHVLLAPDVDLTGGVDLAFRLSRSGRVEVCLVYLLEVTRTLPLNSPMLEEERAASEALEEGLQRARALNLPARQQIERVRDIVDGAINFIKQYEVTQITLASDDYSLQQGSRERFDTLAEALLNRASCEVIIGRLRPRK